MKIFLLSLVIIFVGSFAYAEEIKIVTEDLAPLNYLDNKDGKVKGICTEVVQAVLEEIGINYKIEVLPWARAYMTALNEPNVLIYSMARTSEREELFNWVGEVVFNDIYVFKLAARKDIQLTSLEEAKKYKIGTINNDYPEQYLLNKGFLKGKHLQSIVRIEQLMKLLEYGRVDLVLYNEMSFAHIIRSGDFKPSLFKKVYKIEELSLPLYMAFSKKTSDKIVNQFRRALEIVKQKGIYDKIQEKYTNQ